MRVSEDAMNRSQNPPPPQMGRRYIRKLLEAFEPHQDAMFADLDQQIEETNPEIVSRKLDEVSKQSQKKLHQFEQLRKTEGVNDEASLLTLLEELKALTEEELTLWKQLRPTTRQNNVLKYKRKFLVELLQGMHSIRQEGHWEKIGEEEKLAGQVSILDQRFLVFEFTKQWLHLQTIEDVHEWMKQHRPDFLPVVVEPETQASTPKKRAKSAQRKGHVVVEESLPSVTPAQIYERQAWVRLLVPARHYSSHFQDELGELGVFVYERVKGKPRGMLHLWANGAKQEFPVVEGAISQQQALTDSMRAWLAQCWAAATGGRG